MTYKVALAFLLLAPCFAEAQVERLVLGTGDNGWEELAELMGGMWGRGTAACSPTNWTQRSISRWAEKKGSSRADVFGNPLGGRAGRDAERTPHSRRARGPRR